MWILAYTLVQNDVFMKVPYILWIWDFLDLYLTHVGTRIWSPLIHIYSKKWFFLPQNTTIPLKHREKINIFSNFEHYDLANDKEQVYEIWWAHRHTSWPQDLTIRSTKEGPNFALSALFSRGSILRQFGLNTTIDVWRLKLKQSTRSIHLKVEM
jgi:hypothetical protein